MDSTEKYNAEKVDETYKSTAWVHLDDGTAFIGTDTSAWMGRISSIATTPVPRISKAPFDLALRCGAIIR